MRDEATIVFYVDDNAKSRRLLTTILRESGFEVITASDPLEALGVCKEIFFDLALLDQQMPKMTGSQLAQEIKFLTPDIPIVLISGRGTLPPTELAFVDAHFGSGTTLDELLEALFRVIGPEDTRLQGPVHVRTADHVGAVLPGSVARLAYHIGQPIQLIRQLLLIGHGAHAIF